MNEEKNNLEQTINIETKYKIQPEYLTNKRKIIQKDEFFWYVTMGILYFTDNHLMLGAVFTYGGAAMLWSYISYWKQEKEFLKGEEMKTI